ncbi:hypothetical protein WJX73_004101 [Symbiochloris irregularis]|uniref:Uncharacterized protein n=1 Tax=Symbiochloris irregularis TaxID=706552 RepID=A0AAW1NMI3_9CHLO
MGHHEDAYNTFNQDGEVPHEAKTSHELLGAGAAFFAFRKYENHLKETGKPPSHALFKEILAGAAGFEVDRLAETKGLDAIDRHKAKKHAEQEAEQLYQQQYGNQ